MLKDVNPHWPEVDAETLHAIGRFVVTWGVLERQIDNAVADLYGFDEFTAPAVTANLGTKAKLELFMAGVGIFEDWVHQSVSIADLNKLATDTSTISTRYRNLLAHGQPYALVDDSETDEMFPKQYWIWLRTAARKGGVRMSGPPLQASYFEEAASEAAKMIERWTSFRTEVVIPHSIRREALGGLREQFE